MCIVDLYENENEYVYYKDESTNEVVQTLPLVDDVVLTTNTDIYEFYIQNNKEVHYLDEYLGIDSKSNLHMTLFEIFNHYFDGTVATDIELIDFIYKGLIKIPKVKYKIYCLGVYATFSIFTELKHTIVDIGQIQFSYKYTHFYVGKFFNKINYIIAKEGYNIKDINYIFWDENSLQRLWMPYISNVEFLCDYFKGMSGINCTTMYEVMQYLKPNDTTVLKLNSTNLLDVLRANKTDLKLDFNEAKIIGADTYYKDYTTKLNNVIVGKNTEIGIILDMEGNTSGILQDGCSEMGGIIYLRNDTNLYIIDSFYCEYALLIDTLKITIEKVKSIQKGLFSKVKILTYGTSDSKMFWSSISNLGNKSDRRYFENNIVLVDCYPFIDNYITENFDIDIVGKHTLHNIANVLYVKTHSPLHNPINDAKTLFNVLCKIVGTTNNFVV